MVTGRFTFFRKNLYFSFLGSASTPRPRNIQFIDNKGSIIEEQTLNPTGGAYQNVTGKLCGVWRRVPRDYRKLLREEGLYVSLIWDSTNSLIGQLSRFKGLASEQFSVLLEPADGADRSFILIHFFFVFKNIITRYTEKILLSIATSKKFEVISPTNLTVALINRAPNEICQLWD